jgi:hypothetical protein
MKTGTKQVLVLKEYLNLGINNANDKDLGCGMACILRGRHARFSHLIQTNL